jgi:hypothetical protein
VRAVSIAEEAILPDREPLVWRISAKWAAKALDCTLQGIVHRCHGGCCYSRKGAYWPARAHNPIDGPCFWLGDRGCKLQRTDRPLTCLMYPLVLNASNMWVMHYRGRRGCCAANVDKGPMLIDAMADNLIVIFGEQLASEIRKDVRRGRNPEFVVADSVAVQWVHEQTLIAADTIPQPRSAWECKSARENTDT